MMLFEVGDEVRVRQPTNLFHSELGKVVSIDHVKLTYKVVFHRGNSDVYTCFDLILVKRQEETSMKFKVGNRVRIVVSCMNNNGKEGVISEVDGSSIPYNVTLDDGGTEWKSPGNITKLEEKVMTFKVGDKVKVKDSWFGFTGEVGLIVRIDGPAKYPYRVKFDVVDEEDEELFAEGSLELVTQSFTKSDLKTGMGVVLRNGRKGHILVDTGCVDVIRFLENGNYSCLNDFSDNLTSNYREEHDIVEVYFTEYQYKLLTDQVFDQDCVFKREPKPEPKPEPKTTKMTMKEINEHFGKPIEIVE